MLEERVDSDKLVGLEKHRAILVGLQGFPSLRHSKLNYFVESHMKKLIAGTLVASVCISLVPTAAVYAAGGARQDANTWAPGVRARVSAAADYRLDVAPGKVSVNDLKGRFHLALDGQTKVVLHTDCGQIVATTGEFFVDPASNRSLKVFSGDAHLEQIPASIPASLIEKQAPVPAQASLKSEGKEVALRGPDVRRRKPSGDEFSRRRNKSKGVIRTKPPVNTPPPANLTQPPANTTSLPQDPPPQNLTPQNPPPLDPPVVVEGTNPWWFVGGAALLGGGIALLVNNRDNPNRVVVPASP